MRIYICIFCIFRKYIVLAQFGATAGAMIWPALIWILMFAEAYQDAILFILRADMPSLVVTDLVRWADRSFSPGGLPGCHRTEGSFLWRSPAAQHFAMEIIHGWNDFSLTNQTWPTSLHCGFEKRQIELHIQDLTCRSWSRIHLATHRRRQSQAKNLPKSRNQEYAYLGIFQKEENRFSGSFGY